VGVQLPSLLGHVQCTPSSLHSRASTDAVYYQCTRIRYRRISPTSSCVLWSRRIETFVRSLVPLGHDRICQQSRLRRYHGSTSLRRSFYTPYVLALSEEGAGTNEGCRCVVGVR
jgi:hypothetical protein